VYEVVPDANAGVRVPELRMRLERVASVLAIVADTVAVVVSTPSPLRYLTV